MRRNQASAPSSWRTQPGQAHREHRALALLAAHLDAAAQAPAQGQARRHLRAPLLGVVPANAGDHADSVGGPPDILQEEARDVAGPRFEIGAEARDVADLVLTPLGTPAHRVGLSGVAAGEPQLEAVCIRARAREAERVVRIAEVEPARDLRGHQLHIPGLGKGEAQRYRQQELITGLAPVRRRVFGAG